MHYWREFDALKPAEDGDGLIVRLLNPSAHAARARVRWAPLLGERIRSVEGARLDESPTPVDFDWQNHELQLDVRAGGLVTLRLRLATAS